MRRIIKRIIAQHLIGYVNPSLNKIGSVVRCLVEYQDSTQGVLYQIDYPDGQSPEPVEWRHVPPITQLAQGEFDEQTI